MKINKHLLLNFLIPGIFILVNFIIKFAVIDYRDICHDEPFTIFHAQQDLKSLFAIFTHENNPPLFFLIMHFWIAIFGISPVAVRFLPMLFSVLTVPVLYKTGLKFYNLWVAILATAIFSFSNYHILFSHDTRVYSLFGLLTCISFYAFFSLIKDGIKRKYVWILIISNILLIYSHFFGFFIPFIQFVIVLTFKELRKKYLVKYFKSVLIVSAFYIPYIPILVKRFTSSTSSGTWLETPNLEELYNMIWKFSNAPVLAVAFLILLVAGLVFWIVKRKKVQISIITKSTIIWFLLPFLLIFGISFFIPMFLDRYLVFFSFAFYLLVAIAVNFLFQKDWLKIAVIVTLSGLMLATFKPRQNLYKIKDLVEEVNKYKDKQTAVIIAPYYIDKTFAYYYNLDYFKDFNNLDKNLNSDNIFPVYIASDIDPTKLAGIQKVIYIDAGANDPSIHELLSSLQRLVSVNEEFHGVRLYYFQKE